MQFAVYPKGIKRPLFFLFFYSTNSPAVWMLAQRFTNFRDTVFEGFTAESALYAEAETCLVSLWIPFWDVCWGNEVCIPGESVLFQAKSTRGCFISRILPFKFKRSLTFGCFWIVCVCGNVSELCSVFCSSGHMCRFNMMIRRFNTAPAWILRRVSFQFNCHREVRPMGRHQHISTEWGVNHQNYKNSTIQRIRLMSKTNELHVPQTKELRWSLLLPACASLLSNDLDLQENKT